MHERSARGGWGWVAGGLLFALSASAQAASLVVVSRGSNVDGNAYRDFTERLQAQTLLNNLQNRYSNVQMLRGDQATLSTVLATVRERAAQDSVDLFILAPAVSDGSHGSVLLAQGTLDATAVGSLNLAPAGNSGLRLVYVSGTAAPDLVAAFEAQGARAVVAGPDGGRLGQVFLADFAHRWSQGAGVQESANGAAQVSQNAGQLLKSYLAQEATEGRIVYDGCDVTISTAAGSQISGAFEAWPKADKSGDDLQYTHAPFEQIGIRMAGGMLPGAAIDPDRVPNVSTLMTQMEVPAWTYLSDVFPAGEAGEPGADIWIDGSSVKYLLSTLANWGGGIAIPALDDLSGIHLVRETNDLSITAYFNQEMTLQIQDESRAKNLALYGVHLPKTLQIRVSADNGVLTVTDLDDSPQGHSGDLFMKVKIPVLPDNVYLRQLSLNLGTGDVNVNAGVVGDVITLIANAQLRTKAMKLDIWDTIQSNLAMINWPDFVFAF